VKLLIISAASRQFLPLLGQNILCPVLRHPDSVLTPISFNPMSMVTMVLSFLHLFLLSDRDADYVGLWIRCNYFG
jgi:hypothetical protein